LIEFGRLCGMITTCSLPGKVAMRHLFFVFRASLLALLASAALFALPGRAAVSAEDVQAVQVTVRAQLAAFAGDDAERAFSYAAPNIRTLFQTPENFMAMVRQAYPVVYRPSEVKFLTPKSLDAAVVQPVHLRDGGGQSWLAMYTLQRQVDGGWLISGCVLAPDRSVGA
jgi:Domain of unknown function (DUF4864)